MTDYLAPPVKPINVWNKYYISAGAVGSVGDTMAAVRIKQSSPEMTPKYQAWNSGTMESFYGSNVQDGRMGSFMSGGTNAKTLSRGLPYRSGNRTAIGWVHQDIVPTDRTRETKQAALPQFGWKAQVANVIRAKVTGDSFLPTPGGYTQTGLPRGTQFPRVVDSSAGGGVAITASALDPIFHPLQDVDIELQPHTFPQASKKMAIGKGLAVKSQAQLTGRRG